MWNLISQVQHSGKTDRVTQTADRRHFRKFWQNVAPLLPMGRLVCGTPSRGALPAHCHHRPAAPALAATLPNTTRDPDHASCPHACLCPRFLSDVMGLPDALITDSQAHLPPPAHPLTFPPSDQRSFVPRHSSCPALHGLYRGSSQRLPEPLPYGFPRRCSPPYLAHKPLL